jgi:hypothetical protein
VVESPSSGPRNRGKTRPGGLRGRPPRRAAAGREGVPDAQPPMDLPMVLKGPALSELRALLD